MKRAFEVLTIILAVLAIGFAVKQYFDSRDLITSNKGLTDKVEYLLGTASTKYIDDFPNDVPGIQEVMSGTCRSLDIMVSVPGYAQYSSPKDFDHYKATLVAVAKSTLRENKALKKCLGKKIEESWKDDDKAQVRLLLFQPPQRRTMLEDQFKKDKFLLGLRNPSSETSKKFINFFTANPRLIQGTTPDAYLQKVRDSAYDDFLDQLQKLHHQHEEQYCNEGILIKYSPEQFSTFLWLQDNDQAAFSYDTNKITFKTNDQTLVKSFRSVFEDAWKRGISFDNYKEPPSKTKMIALEK
jgi:hypothetical protein